MSDSPTQPPASEQYQDWKKFPNTYKEPTHQDWLRELAASDAELATLHETVSELTHNQRIQDSATAAVMERAENAEAELSTYRQWAEVEIADLRDDVRRLHAEKMAYYEATISLGKQTEQAEDRAAANEKDAQRYRWLRREDLLDEAGNVFDTNCGKDLDDAVDKAMGGRDA